MIWILLMCLLVYSAYRLTGESKLFDNYVLMGVSMLVIFLNFVGSAVQLNASDLTVAKENKFYVRDLRETDRGYFYTYTKTSGDSVSIIHTSSTLKVYTSKNIEKPMIIERYLVKEWEPFFGLIPLKTKETYLIIPTK